jgi:hypothetical protein
MVTMRYSRTSAALALVLLATLLGTIHSLQIQISGIHDVNLGRSFAWGLAFWYLLIPIAAIGWYLVKRWPIGARPYFRNVTLHLVTALALGSLHPYVFVWAYCLIISPHWVVATAEAMFTYMHFWYFQALIIAISSYALTIFAVQGISYYYSYHSGLLRAARLEVQLANANLTALKMQLQPHFLFNALHSISALQLTDVAAAQKMIMLLGDFLRLTLHHVDQQLVTVRQEVEFLSCYLAIEQMRFGERLQVRFDIQADAMKAAVPQLILQPLVENSVRHGVAPIATPGSITIRALRDGDQLRLEVEDNGSGSVSASIMEFRHEGVGLPNTRARLLQLYGSQCTFMFEQVVPCGLKVILQIPYCEL